MSDPVQIQSKKLEEILRILKGPSPKARVGVLGGGTRSGEGTNNATVGAAHEYGTSTLPRRSFLRVPLTNELQDYLEKAGAFTDEVMQEILKARSLLPFMKKVAATAENVVQDAFDSAGFGEWPPSDMTHKKVQQTLVETQQLRNSITSEVK